MGKDPDDTSEVVGGLIVNQFGEACFLERIDTRNAGKLCLPGGKVKFKETHLMAIYRELKEEINLDGVNVNYAKKIRGTYISPCGNFTVHTYWLRLFSHFSQQLHTISSSEGKLHWIKFENLPDDSRLLGPIRQLWKAATLGDFEEFASNKPPYLLPEESSFE